MEIDYKQWIAGIRKEIREISVAELAAVPGTSPIIIDVRQPEEHEQGSIPGALLIPRGQLEGAVGDLIADPQTDIVLYCSVGERSALAAHSLGLLGYRNVASLAEGFEGWKRGGQPWSVPDVLPVRPTLERSRRPSGRSARPVQPPPPASRGWRSRPAPAPCIEGRGDRRRRTGIARRPISRRGRHRHARHRRLRRG